MKKLFFIFLMCFTALTMQAQSNLYVDLGLPSGTLWKSTNEKGGFYTYDNAVVKFGNRLPTQEQFAELIAFCTWTWTGKGYKVTGENGKSIVWHCAGCRTSQGYMKRIGSGGFYWSSSSKNSEYANHLYFSSDDISISSSPRNSYQSVRLVKSK